MGTFRAADRLYLPPVRVSERTLCSVMGQSAGLDWITKVEATPLPVLV